MLALEVQQLTTCDKYLQGRCSLEQLAHYGRGLQKMLEVIQDQQQLLGAQIRLYPLNRRSVADFSQAEHLHHRRHDEVRLAERRQVYEVRPIDKCVEEIRHDLERKPSLACP